MWGTEFEGVGKAYDIEEVWRGMAKNLRAVPIPECGHQCQEERPDIVSEELASFLAGWRG